MQLVIVSVCGNRKMQVVPFQVIANWLVYSTECIVGAMPMHSHVDSTQFDSVNSWERKTKYVQIIMSILFAIANQCIKMDITFFLQHVLAVHTVKVVRRDVYVTAVPVIRRQANVCVWQAEQATSVLNVSYTVYCNTIMTLVLYYNKSSKVTLQSNGNVDGQL